MNGAGSAEQGRDGGIKITVHGAQQNNGSAILVNPDRVSIHDEVEQVGYERIRPLIRAEKPQMCSVSPPPIIYKTISIICYI